MVAMQAKPLKPRYIMHEKTVVYIADHAECEPAKRSGRQAGRVLASVVHPESVDTITTLTPRAGRA